MHPFYFDFCCSMLTFGTNFNSWARNEKKQVPVVTNAKHGLALGTILTSAFVATLQDYSASSLQAVMLFPCVISLTTSGVAYVARKNSKFSSQKINSLEQKVGKLLDSSSRIASVAMLLFLAPSASAAPVLFALTTLFVAHNFLNGRWHDRKAAENNALQHSIQNVQ